MYTRAYPNEIVKTLTKVGEVVEKGLNSIAHSAEKLSKLEGITSPTGLDISQGTLYRLLCSLNNDAKEKIKFNLNLSTLTELVELLDIELRMAEKIVMKRYDSGYFESFEDLKNIDGMTDELLFKIQKQTFICIPNF
jgi:DNA uptake protein ComE-like DNA-binding protein